MNIKKAIVPGTIGLAAFVGIAGGSAINALSASADTTASTAATTSTSTPAASTDTSSTSSTTSQPAQRDESKGGHVANGVTETLLTGDTATKATAAAEAAVSGGTVLRVENDAEGATYEAHVKKSDGTQVTVKMDANFKVTGTESGPGGPSTSSSTN